ncbi:MAG: hypothetical protein BroJett003_13810 [Planctomycetota bacterium]|nr:MAG: hypothetical protein BroJett003_13810 [Planctomycetota bacterium]
MSLRLMIFRYSLMSLALLLSAASCRKSTPAEPPSEPPSASAPGGSSSAAPTSGAGGSAALPAPAAGQVNALPPGHPPVNPPAVTESRPAPVPLTSVPVAKVADGTFEHAGLVLTIPESWTNQPLPLTPMAPVCILHLPPEGAAQDLAEVRITYFPSMHGMPPDLNIDRWLKQMKDGEGKDLTREAAKITSRNVGDLSITIVDASGQIVISGPGMPATNIADGRMIAAIVDHPRGPHFIKITGPKVTLDKWAEAAYAFIETAKLDSAEP